MTIDLVPDCIKLWVSQFKEARGNLQHLPVQWSEDTDLLQSYLEQHLEKGQGIVSHSGGELVGFMTYDRFMFHGEETAFSPITGHASVPQGRSRIYQVMYRHLSGVWVSDGALNHMITSYTSDRELVDSLFHLGFGVYVVDGFRDVSPVPNTGNVTVREANLTDLAEVKRLATEFRHYFLQPPVFLVNKQEDDEYYSSLLNNKNGSVFVTESDCKLTGVLYIRINDKPDVYSLAAKGVGKIDKLGAYIEKSARGSGNGLVLLKAAVDWCGERGINIIHVDFESANLYASGFWTKHFTPSLYSLRRKVNQDILG